MTRYWTNQTIEAWEKAQDIGYLVGNSDFIWEEMLRDYHWMMSQMKKRIPNYLGGFPIWLWTEKPDLRRSGHFNGGTHAVSGYLISDEVKAFRVSDSSTGLSIPVG